MGARTDSLRSLDRQSISEADPSVRQAVLSRLQGPAEARGDVDELLAAAAKALKDAGILEYFPTTPLSLLHLHAETESCERV